MQSTTESPSASSKSYQFRSERQESWTKLESLVGKAEKKGLKSLNADEVLELPHLYRGALSSLSVARSISLDRNVVIYLEALSARTYFLLYGQHQSTSRAFIELFTKAWPQAMRSIGQELWLATTVFMLGLIAAYFLVASDPDWYFSFVNQELAGGRQPGADVEYLRGTLYTTDKEANNLDVFATMLFTHNARIGIMAFALGFALGLPTLWLLFTNGAMLGAFLSLFASKGLLYELGGWLIIHGSTEISAIVICGAAGLAISRHYVFPGKLSRMESLAKHGKQAAIVAFGCVMMFFAAGLLEGFARQLVNDDVTRYVIGLTIFALWVLYFSLGGRSGARDEMSDETGDDTASVRKDMA
ncbi:stage II sporulation protein M [Kordiimonas sp. SCSIO 12610]|uniref:stage II sporulation protein M n=1 Tax=Kordiimonas sp. SCSIO 12610 TaxID=2829597 RepID=UPI00210CF4E2|nr:stage II sporulation protein M [Kordiimonas sp. SCSIO 12610]UTW56327.1 stage II sporulation protein M [Kordiimonas sp. SCSIO 12610]